MLQNTIALKLWAMMEKVISLIRSDNSIDVNVQDQTTDRVSLFLAEVLGDITLLSGATKDASSFNITTDGVVPVVGNFVCLQENEKITQVEIVSVTPVAGNEYTIGVAIPLDVAYSASGGCTVQNVDMNVNGSVTPVSFRVAPVPGTTWDITRMIVSMTHASQGDDGLYGNIAKLTNGVYYRKEDGQTSQNLYNARENSDYRIEGYDVAFPVRSGGGGTHGTAARITFAGQDKSGVVIRLDGDLTESFLGTVRDDLSPLTTHRVKVQGHVVQD